MSNELYNNYGPQNNLINQFNKFRKNFTGNPRDQIQQMLNSGKISQAQYNQAVQRANAIRSLLGI